MANQCFPLLRGKVARATRLDACGNPVLGPDSVVVSDGLISVALTAVTVDGETISVPNMAGKICVLDEPAPTFTGYTAVITLCAVNPVLINIFTNQPLVNGGTGSADIVGFRVNSGVELDGSGFALELWTGVPASACLPGQSVASGYMLFPFFQGGTLGDFTVENGAVSFTINGARTKDGTAWGVGPYDVTLGPTGLPDPLLEPLDAQDHLHLEKVSVAPPEPDCDPIALGVPATGATAGTPGTYTPANSYGPANFASIGALTASPNTAWTTGQRIVLRDGSLARWSGTAWVVGAA